MARIKRSAEIDAPPVFEFCVKGPALSAQAKNRSRLRLWQETVSEQARIASAESAVILGNVDVRLTEFSELRHRDRDNMAKPILDAMQDILFSNDRQIASLEVDWRDIEGRYKVRHMSPVVAKALSAGHEFVWIRIYLHRPKETLLR